MTHYIVDLSTEHKFELFSKTANTSTLFLCFQMKQTFERHFHFCLFHLVQVVWIHPQMGLVHTLCKSPGKGKPQNSEILIDHLNIWWWWAQEFGNLGLDPVIVPQNDLRPLVRFLWESALYLLLRWDDLMTHESIRWWWWLFFRTSLIR